MCVAQANRISFSFLCVAGWVQYNKRKSSRNGMMEDYTILYKHIESVYFDNMHIVTGFAYSIQFLFCNSLMAWSYISQK